MIVFTHSAVDLTTLYHETMHQWWGDNVESRLRRPSSRRASPRSASPPVARREAQRRWAVHPQGTLGLRAVPRASVRRALCQGRQLLEPGPSCPSAVSLRRRLDIRAARCGLSRVARHPGGRPVHRGAGADPAPRWRWHDHRGRAARRVRRVPADTQPGMSRPVVDLLRRVVRYGLPRRRWSHPARGDRAGAGRTWLLHGRVPRLSRQVRESARRRPGVGTSCAR